MENSDIAKENLAKKIGGEIVLSSNPGKTIQKWRNIFRIPQRTLANEIGIMPSVISDYENGRRKSPGIRILKKFIDAMLRLDERAGGRIIREFSEFPLNDMLREVIIDMKEFSVPVSIENFCKKLNVSVVERSDKIGGEIYGYTVIDSMKAITNIPPTDLVKLYGLTNERALIFTGVKHGKSAMVALKVTNLRPKLVILHGALPGNIDELTKKIAKTEGIVLGCSKQQDVDLLVKNLKISFGKE